MSSNFASSCVMCHGKRYATERCRKDYGHTGCDWRKADLHRDQQEEKAKRTSESSLNSTLHSRSTPGGCAAGRPEDRETDARRYLCYVCRVFTLFFYLCCTVCEHTDCGKRQENLAIGEVGTLCTKCRSGHEEEPMLLCDEYVPPWIFGKKKSLLISFTFSLFLFTKPQVCGWQWRG